MKKLKYIVCGLCLATGLTGCDDFLEILPMNEVVLENYWTEKQDVASVVNSCYETMESADFLNRMGVWGELRSENLRMGSNIPNEINDILKENLLPTNPYCNWSVFYKAINYCNTVCHYAPEVQQIDPNYTEAEMRANIAEVTALRSLCYFYLARTFRDVPYTTRPSIDDTESFAIPAIPFEEMLDTLIADLERVKGDAVRRYYTDDSPNQCYNSSRVTRQLVYALLADLYLWKGDWDNSVKYCDLVLDFKRQQYEEMLVREGNDVSIYIELFGDIPMILSKPQGQDLGGYAYTDIFGAGNSFESIFELYFESNQDQKNTWVNDFYGSSSNNYRGRLSAPDFLRKEVIEGTNTVFSKTDGRAFENVRVEGATYAISKFVYQSIAYKTKSVTSESTLDWAAVTHSSAKSAHWMFYRLTDVMLIKAEALIMRGSSEEDRLAAFELINSVNKRANCGATPLGDASKYTTKASMEELLMAERHREFMFEGKRWFDLVRIARRDGNNRRLVEYASRKYIENVNAIKIKLADPNIIYFPYAKSELKVNPLLKQNPAYGKDENTELTH